MEYKDCFPNSIDRSKLVVTVLDYTMLNTQGITNSWLDVKIIL